MGLTKAQKIAVVGGVIVSGSVAAYFIVKALAEEPPAPPPKRYRCTGAPDYLCVEDPLGLYDSLEACELMCKSAPPLPVGVEFPASPYTLYQTYRPWIDYVWELPKCPFSCQHLNCKPETNGVEGYKALFIEGRVIDAMGNGVPGITVQIWTSLTPDSYHGTLTVDGKIRTVTAPLECVTDSMGWFKRKLEYRTAMDWLCEQACKQWPINVPAKPCDKVPLPYMWITCGSYTTPGHIYAVSARIKGTTRTGQAVVTTKAALNPPGTLSRLEHNLNDNPLLYPE